MKRGLGHWLGWLATFVVVPMMSWVAFAAAEGRNPKSLANVVEEPFFVACVGLCLFIVWWLGNRKVARVAPLVLLAVACAIAIVVALFVPTLPE
jgi:hypothetical protein